MMNWVLCLSICESGGLFCICVCLSCVWMSLQLCVCVKCVFMHYEAFIQLCILTLLFVCMCVRVCLIALVTQAVSHSRCSKLWVGEGHCGADRGDRKERGDGGWVGEKATEKDDNEKLKAVRKWDVGLHSRAILQKSMYLPGGLSFFYLFEGGALRLSVEDGGLWLKIHVIMT